MLQLQSSFALKIEADDTPLAQLDKPSNKRLKEPKKRKTSKNSNATLDPKKRKIKSEASGLVADAVSTPTINQSLETSPSNGTLKNGNTSDISNIEDGTPVSAASMMLNGDNENEEDDEGDFQG